MRERMPQLQGSRVPDSAEGRRLRDALENAQGRELGEAIRLLVTRADLFFEERRKGKSRWFSFVRGVVKVRPFLDVSGVSGTLPSGTRNDTVPETPP